MSRPTFKYDPTDTKAAASPAANGKKEIENFEGAFGEVVDDSVMEDKIDGDTAEISNVVLLKHFPDDKAVIDASVERE